MQVRELIPGLLLLGPPGRILVVAPVNVQAADRLVDGLQDERPVLGEEVTIDVLGRLDPAVPDDGLRRWGEAQVQVAAQVMPVAERIERSAVFGMPDLTAMPTAATNDWMSAAHPGLVVTLPDV